MARWLLLSLSRWVGLVRQHTVFRVNSKTILTAALLTHLKIVLQGSPSQHEPVIRRLCQLSQLHCTLAAPVLQQVSLVHQNTREPEPAQKLPVVSLGGTVPLKQRVARQQHVKSQLPPFPFLLLLFLLPLSSTTLTSPSFSLPPPLPPLLLLPFLPLLSLPTVELPQRPPLPPVVQHHPQLRAPELQLALPVVEERGRGHH
ncbi:unnamed protein product [Closterium sp. NIES-53]